MIHVARVRVGVWDSVVEIFESRKGFIRLGDRGFISGWIFPTLIIVMIQSCYVEILVTWLQQIVGRFLQLGQGVGGNENSPSTVVTHSFGYCCGHYNGFGKFLQWSFGGAPLG